MVGYLKWICYATVALYAVAFVVLNAGNQSDVWLFVGRPWRVSTLVVIVVTAVLSLALGWLTRQIVGAWWRRGRGKDSA